MLDGKIYEQVKDYLVSLCQTELETYETVHNTFNQLLNSSNGVSLQTHSTTSPQNIDFLIKSDFYLSDPLSILQIPWLNFGLSSS